MTTTTQGTGYGLVTKTLHWVTVAALAAQFTIGYLLESDDSDGGRGRGRGRGGDSGRGRGRGGDDLDEGLLWVHVALGVTILLLAVIRVLWRRAVELPPWAETLSETERRLAHWTERVLYLTLFVIPLSGLAMVLTDDDDLLWLHVTGHVVFFAALAAHVGLVLKHQLVDRDRLLRRML